MPGGPQDPVTYKELSAMSRDELIRRHDELLRKDYIGVGLDYYLEALRSKTMLRYTWWIAALTLIVTVATIINVVIAYWC